MVTLGGNGKRDGHVRVPPYDRGRCIVYVQAGAFRVYFPFLPQGFWDDAQRAFNGLFNEL